MSYCFWYNNFSEVCVLVDKWLGGDFPSITKGRHNLSLLWQKWTAWRILLSQRAHTRRGWSLAETMEGEWKRHTMLSALPLVLFLRGDCIHQVQGAVIITSWVPGPQSHLIDLLAPAPFPIKLLCLFERDREIKSRILFLVIN